MSSRRSHGRSSDDEDDDSDSFAASSGNFKIEEFTKIVKAGGVGTTSSEFKFHIGDDYKQRVTLSAEKHRVALTTCLFFAFGTIGMAMSSLGPVFLELGS